MTDRALIMCVDDEPVNLAIMEELLQENYQLDTRTSGEDCLQQVGLHKPDLILLDVNMPDIDGLETCRSLRQDPLTSDIPIIFISALASHAELMAGYEAGGDDYITKPFSEDILQKKIDVVLASQRRKSELRSISDQAVEALQDNLSNTEALSIVINFLSQSHALKNIETLASQVLECLRRLELEGSLLLVGEDQPRIWFSDDIDRPMERQILESLRGQDHVVSFGTRVAVNSDNATLLVRKLPVDQERTRRLHKLLEVLMEGLDVRIREMQSEQLLNERRELLRHVLLATTDSLTQIAELQQGHKDRSSNLMAKLGGDLKKSLADLELSQMQSRPLVMATESAAGQMDSMFDDGLEISAHIEGIIDELSQALEK